MMAVLYTEKPKKATWVMLIMLMGVIAVIIGTVVGWLDNSQPKILLTAMMLIIITFVYSFFQLTYEIHDTYVLGKFWPFTTKVNYDDIKIIELKPVPWYVGVGFRFGPGYRVINTRDGIAVHIVRKDGVNIYYTPNNPKEFIQRIKNGMR